MTPKQAYSEKLKDPRWQKLRLLVFERDDFSCRLCGDKQTTLHVHHTEYSGNPWQVDIQTLYTICEHCHLIISLDKKLPSKILGVIKSISEGNVLIAFAVDDSLEKIIIFYSISGSTVTPLVAVTEQTNARFNEILSNNRELLKI